GWVSNYQIAASLLREFEIPATVFITTGKIGASEPFWQQSLGCIFKYAKYNQEVRRLLEKLLNRTVEINRSDYVRAVRELKSMPWHKLSEQLKLIPTGPPMSPTRRFLDINEIRDMSKYNVDFGSHT